MEKNMKIRTGHTLLRYEYLRTNVNTRRYSRIVFRDVRPKQRRRLDLTTCQYGLCERGTFKVNPPIIQRAGPYLEIQRPKAIQNTASIQEKSKLEELLFRLEELKVLKFTIFLWVLNFTYHPFCVNFNCKKFIFNISFTIIKYLYKL